MWSTTGRDQVLGQRVLLHDLQVAVDHHAAVEGGDRRVDVERLEQHLHAAWRATAGQGEDDTGLAQGAHRRDGGVGEDLLPGDERAVHVGQEEADRLARSSVDVVVSEPGSSERGSEAMGRW